MNDYTPPHRPAQIVDKSGHYRLTMLPPIVDRAWTFVDKETGKTHVGFHLMFVTEDGSRLFKGYSTANPSMLAMLVGRIIGTYARAIGPDASAAQLAEYLKPATNKPFDVDVEVTPDTPYNGKERWRYRLVFAKNKTVAADLPPQAVKNTESKEIDF